MGAIDEFVADDESIIWRGRANRKLYVAWARRLAHGSNVIAAAVLFGGLSLFDLLPFPANLALVLVLLAVNVGMAESRIKHVAFFGAYAITDARILRLNMRLSLATMPLDSQLTYRITHWMGACKVHFSHPGHRTIRFACLTETDVAELEEAVMKHSNPLEK